MPEGLLHSDVDGWVAIPLTSEGVLRHAWESRYGTDRDFTAFASAPGSAFAPNPALKAALTQVRRKVRRA